MRRKPDALEDRARELCLASGVDPDQRMDTEDGGRGHPAWTEFRDAARAERSRREAEALRTEIVQLQPQAKAYQDAPLLIHGKHDEGTILQMKNCMDVGNVVRGVICADGHLGYAQPVGGVIAYEDQISVSGVGFDIACGNMAVKLDTEYSEIIDRIPEITRDIAKAISFGVGRTNDERVEHELFDDTYAWSAAGMTDYRSKAQAQLGTVGSGNHYVDLFHEEADGRVWIGVHFGSRGLGHTIATRFTKAAGGKDGIHVAPALVNVNSPMGQDYLAGMELAGQYAYAGREWVVERVRRIVGGTVVDSVHNHHNYAWRENHVIDGESRQLWVVRKGATPAFPGQRGFVGGSMGDNAVIIEGLASERSRDALYSTVHGAGRVFGRKEAKRRFDRAEMDSWLREEGVTLAGGDLDESPMAYRRLNEVLAYHTGTIRVLHVLRPVSVVMAGEGEFDPWKD